MELECDLGTIKNEELLRRMWQQSEDVNRKKEIRLHLSKLREARLRDLYQGDIMSDNPAAGFGKDVLTTSHGDSLADQSFQSLKSKEIRDSMSPTHDIKFHSLALKQPNNTGWDVQTSSEVSPDGRAFRSETVATTDGVERLNGGVAEFKGRNEQRSSASHQGDDKNFVKQASDSAKTHLHEHVVIGDENSGRTEMKTTSTSSSSSSKVVQSSSTVEYDDQPVDNRYLTDSTGHHQQQQQQRQQQDHYRQQQRQHELTQQQQQQFSEEYKRSREEKSTNIETQQLHEQTRRLIDVDKSTPEYQAHVQQLMAQPGEIISNTVEYPKPNVKMITTVKRLPDGTIVRNKRYETEELRPTSETAHQRNTSSTNQSNTQRKTQTRTQDEENIYKRTGSDHVDTVDGTANVRRAQDRNTRDSSERYVDESSFSSTKQSNRHFSTETTSETVQEHGGHPTSRKGQPQDFTTHGFPSVKTNKPTQEFPTDRPHGMRSTDVHYTQDKHVTDSRKPKSDFTTHGFPSVRPTARTADEVVTVSSETTSSMKKKMSSERVTESEIVTEEGYPSNESHRPERITHASPHKPQDFTTHGFPSVREPSAPREGSPRQSTPSREQPSTSRHPHSQPDFSTHGFPSVKPNKPTQEYANERPHTMQSTDVQHYTTTDGDVITASSEVQRSMKQKTSSERVTETEIITDEGYPSNEKITYTTTSRKPQDFTTHGFPSVRESSTPREGSPRQSTPSREHPSGSHRPQPKQDFTTHGFPSVKPNKLTQEYPSGRPHTEDEVVIVSSATSQRSKQKSSSERIIETEVITEGDYSSPSTSQRRPQDFTTHGFPSVRESSPLSEGSPRHGTPSRDYPSSPRRSQHSPDFSTHGFPSVKSPTRTTPDFSTHGFPSVKDKASPKPNFSSPKPKSQPITSTTKKSSTTETKTVPHKEKEVDAAHRAFAASLRSSSPVDSPRRDSHFSDHQRLTPRSSVSSTKSIKRDVREGSHDSATPSETSRISTSTVTRQSPGKSVGKTVVTKQTVVKTRQVNGSNEKLDLTPQRSTKSPSPGKTVTTTTTKTTTTRKTPTEVPKPDNQITKPAENLLPINEPLTITKTSISTNDASFPGNEVVEEPCLKKNFYKLGPSDHPTQNFDDASTQHEPHTSNEDTKTTTTEKTDIATTTTKATADSPVITEVESTTTTKSTITKPKPTEQKISKHVTYENIDEGQKLHEQPAPTGKTSPLPTPGRSRVITESVAARRNIFEKGVTSTPTKPSSQSPAGRRPSYMEHTKSSLEHRKDSLEVNKTNYSRKTSVDDEVQFEQRPNSAVKFDVPQKPHKPQREVSTSEELNVEEIFDLDILEELLETVTSYELRRRIRAQIRLVKKNMLNSQETKASTTIRSSYKTSSTSSSKMHHEETDNSSDGKPLKKPNDHAQSPHRSSNVQHEETVVISKTRDARKPRDRSHSPEGKTISSSLKEVRKMSGSQTSTSKHYTEQFDYSASDRKQYSPESPQFERKKSTPDSPRSERKQSSPERKPTPKPRERSSSPEYHKKPAPSQSSSSPEPKTKPYSNARSKIPDDNVKPQPHERSRSRSPVSKASGHHVTTHATTKTTVHKTYSPERPKTPIWADRKNILKNQTTTTSSTTTVKKAPASPITRTSATKTTKATSSSQRQTNKSTEEDCITSSYGIGPTDENGLPLFGIRALKKKKQTSPCDTTEEVTGYVVEEKYYSDSKTKPTVERKEFIYSTNAEELEAIKQKVQSRKSSNDDGVTRKFQKIDKEFLHDQPKSIMPSGEEFSSTSTSQYTRRGSVKEMSEKFIRKESSQSITEKSSGYPKAGLILRTNSRLGTPDAADCFESEIGHHSTDEEISGGSEIKMHHTSRMVAESESESESVNIQREMKQKSTTSSTRSFLNSSGESKRVTGVDDVLERMRNADNVVEDGDTAEDQEARALLNKFLGASVIMRGVETALPATKQTKITSSAAYASDGNDNTRKQEFKTTRVTKTLKSGSSSSPVTQTTCDIEEIWDEDILKALLEQATTYEERRKIRARLRELMAEREEQHATSTTEKMETKEKDGAVVTTTTKVTTRTVTAGAAPKPVSPFAKFKQLDRQSSQQSSKSPATPTTPGGTASPSGSGAVLFKFTDPALNARAATVKDQLLMWCQSKTKEYENVQIINFSSSWSDGLAFCALIHHFLPEAFDYSELTPQSRRKNFEIAFTVADEKAGIAPLLDVEDMVVMKRPDWKSVFVYVQSIYRRFRNCQ